MSRVTDAPEGALADHVLEIDADELEALREVAREADGRKNTTKTARRVLGVSYE